jgi:hypothetical protein
MCFGMRSLLVAFSQVSGYSIATRSGRGAWSIDVLRVYQPETRIVMAKTQNSKKQTKKAPLKTADEKRAAKRAKKAR